MKVLILFISMLFSSPLYANILGSDIQNFNPTTNGLDFLTVHSSQTLQPFQVNIGAFGNYSYNSLPYSTVSAADNTQSLFEVNDQIVHSYLNLGIGIIQGWELGASMTFMNSQTMKRSNFVFNYGDPGVDELRFTSKFRVVNEDSWGGAIILGIDLNQMQDNPFVGDNAGPTFNIEGALDFKLTSNILWAVNLGYRLRSEGTPLPNSGIIPISDQIIYSTALSYLFGDNGSALIGELYGGYPIDQPPTVPTDRQLSNLEGLLSYRWRALDNFDLYGGLGSEVYHGLGSPDFRAFAGINFKWGLAEYWQPSSQKDQPKKSPIRSESMNESEVDSDGDGVPDSRDKCPNTWNQNYVNQEGCVESDRSSPTEGEDQDGDGVLDSKDQCPNTTPGARVNAYGCEIPDFDT